MKENTRFVLGFLLGVGVVILSDIIMGATTKPLPLIHVSHDYDGPPQASLHARIDTDATRRPQTQTRLQMHDDPYALAIETKTKITSTSRTIHQPNATLKGSSSREPDASPTNDPKNYKNQTFEDFVHHPGVVIAVKIHGENHVQMLKQSLCLLHAAYNHRTLYDVLIFTTLGISEASVDELGGIVHPASLTVAVDPWTLQDHLDHMDEAQRGGLLARCYGANATSQLQWGTRCQDSRHKMPIAYTWMSEFRAKHIWQQPALQKYKYMLWFDSDSFPMAPWEQDPVAYMMRNQLVLGMGNFAQGKTLYRSGVQDKVYEVYNKSVCKQSLSRDTGRLQVKYGKNPKSCPNSILQVHGFFHITDLDFYRLPVHQLWFQTMIGRATFSRVWDDQLAVVIPPTMTAPERAVEFNGAAGFDLKIMHNGMLMGKKSVKGGGYLAYFRREGRTIFPNAVKWCKAKRMLTTGSR